MAPCSRLVECLWTSVTDLDTEVFGALLLVTSAPFHAGAASLLTQNVSFSNFYLPKTTSASGMSARSYLVWIIYEQTGRSTQSTPLFFFMPDVHHFNAPENTSCGAKNKLRPQHRLSWTGQRERTTPLHPPHCAVKHAQVHPSCSGFCSSLLYTLLLWDISSPSGFIFYSCQ